MLGRRSGTATGELKVQDGRVFGKASQPLETEGMFPSGFDAQFDVALLKAGQSLPASTVRKGGPAANVKPTVTGTFKGNGKDAKLTSVSARWGEPFSGKPGIVLVFTEKDHSKDEQAALKALFGDFGSALVIGIQPDGKVVTCDILHEAHKQKPISSPASVRMTDFKNEGGQISGRLVTEGKQEAFEQTWEVNLVFKTKAP